MALSTANITYDLQDLLGGEYWRSSAKADITVVTNVPKNLIVDTDGNKIRLGAAKQFVGQDGTGVLTVWVPGPGSNPTTWQTSFIVNHPDASRRDHRGTRTFGPYTITGDANLADLVEQQEIPPTYLTQVTAQLDAIRDDAQGFADEAAAHRAAVEQVVITDLGATDGQWKTLAETDGTLTKAHLDDTFATRGKVIPAAVVDTYGHSFMHGSTTGSGGSSIGVSDMATLIAAGLDLPIRQHAVSGAALYTSASAGDWADVMQAEARSTDFEARGGAFAVIYGLNDAANIGHTYSELAPFKSALSAIVCRMRAAAVFENDHASMSTTGTWSTASSTGRNSGSSYSYANASGATRVWTPPAEFPGGTVTALLPAYGDGGTATWQATVNGITYTVNTADYALSGNNPTVGVMRIPNVKRTNGPITFTVTAVSGAGAARAMWDCVMWEPTEAACPIVALIGQPKPLDYTSQSGAPAGPVTDAGVDVINQIIGEVVDLFGERVVYVDTSTIDSDPDYWSAGNVHPNGAGHAYIADETIAAIKAVSTIVPAPAKAVPAPPTDKWTNYVPTLTGITLGSGTVLASYCIRANGSVEFYAKVTLAADSAITGDVTIALPTPAALGHTRMGFEVFLFDNGTARYKGGAYLSTASVATVRSTGTNGVLTSLGATAPFTWTTSDAIELGGSYRKAA